MVGVRKLLSLLVLVALVTAGLGAWAPAAQAADTGNAAPQPGRIVSDEPGKNTPHILDGTAYSVAKVGNTIVVGGQFTQVQNYGTSQILTRRNLVAFDAVSGKISSTFAPDPAYVIGANPPTGGIVYKVLPASDGKSVYVAGAFNSAAGQLTERLVKVDVKTGAMDPTFKSVPFSGDIRDLELVGNRLFVAGKFTHINGVSQLGLGTVFADTGKRDPYFNAVLSGLHNPGLAGSATNVLQISVNKQNSQLMGVGNFTTVDGQARRQIVKFDITDPVHQALSPWYTNLFTQQCSLKFDTYVTDVEYSPDGSYFVVSTTGAYGGTASNSGTSGCDVVARFENAANTGPTPATWTAYTGGDTTWTVEVTENAVYAGGHQRWQNNPTVGDQAGQGAVSREGIAALNPLNGMPYSWNPTRVRGVGVQDMLATSEGLYVGSDTTEIGHTDQNKYHARIGLLPLASGAKLPQQQATQLPVDLFRVASGGSQLTRRSFTGTTVGTATNAPTGPGWGTSTGAFMVNGDLYQTNTAGTLSKMTFDGTNYGTASPVVTADALVAQTDWHNDAKTLTSLFYAAGRIYYSKSGTNALYRRGFEVEDGVVGQQRFTSPSSSINWSNTRGAFVVGNKLYFATSSGTFYSATWNQATHNIVTGTLTQVTTAGTGWGSRAMFPLQSVPAPLNEAPSANASISCDALQCTFDATASTDPENGALSYDWDFGDGSAHGTGATATHTYADAGDRPVTLIVTDDKGATSSIARTASPSSHADEVNFVASRNNNGNRFNHTITAPTGTQVGDTLLLFFASNSTAPVYTGPSGWTPVLSETGASFVGRLYSKKATAGDIGTSITVTSRNADGTNATVKSDVTVAAYRGLGSSDIDVSASTSQGFSSNVHQTPTVDAEDGTSWLVSYWSDKSTTATGTPTNWTGPASQTQRAEGNASGSSHMSSLLADSNARVGKGGQGGLNATADVSAQGLTMSVLLTGNDPPPANQSPVALASQTGCTNLECSFDGGSSTDPEGGALTYDWNWGDGTEHGTTATPSHTFSSGGNKTVTLTVTDPQGATGTDTVTATPTEPPPNQAPTATISSASCTNKLVCSFNGSTSSDPDTDTLTYSWNFGDTSTATTANPSHTYSSSGARTVTLTVDDGHGHTDSDTVNVNPTNLAPTAAITEESCTDLSCSFKGSTSSDPEGDTLTYSWDFGDTSTSTTANPSHTYSSSGARTVTLTVDDGHGNTNADTVTVNPTPNLAPTAHITEESCSDLSCSFKGSTSTDPEGDTLTYSWDFGDSSSAGSGATTSHNYSTSGDKTVTLTVDDGHGNTDTDTVTVTPTDPPPNLAPTAHITEESCVDLSCSFKGSTSTDPEGDTLTYSWDFGDSTSAGSGATPSHNYTTSGDKAVTLTVNDGHGNTDTDTVTVTPTDPPNTAPTAHITDVNCADLECSFSGATSTDPDDDTLSYSWDFGDSTPAGSGATPSHTYADAGARTVTLTVDDGNGHTATDTATANPADAPVSHVAFVGANSSNGNRLNHITALPGGVQVGDTLIAFFTANSTSVPITGPVGWTLLQTRDGNAIAARAYTKTATLTDTLPGARVTVTTSPSGTFNGYVKSDLTVASYRGLDGTTPIAASASKTDNATGATHVSPAVTATDTTSWLVTYWADKSDNTTGWTAPAGETVRQAAATVSGTGHITALLTDGNAPVSNGANGQLTATANSTSTRGASFSILLKSS